MTKTTRVMLAVLAACGTSAALAQSSVNVYGRVNTTIENTKIGNDRVTEMNTNSSFIGFRGVEDLGNGLKAGFVLEGNFNSDDGAGSGKNGQFNFKRNSEINLSGNFGMLRLGAYDPYSYTVTADTISMHNHDTGISADALYLGNHTVSGSNGNKLAYRTPNIAGFDAEVQYSFGEKTAIDDPATVENRGAWDLGVNYANGPLGLGLGYSKEKARDIIGTEQGSAQQFALRASYAIGDLTLGAYYQRQELKWDADKVKRNAYRLAAMYTMGASEFHANIGRADKLKANGVKLDNTAATQWTLAYNYNLSKRTKVYALYTNINNVNGTTGGIVEVFDTGVIPTEKEKLRSFGVGIRHLF
ncbi:porin [Comamonas jiangduensis]|uniref:porin n=1 Tax=Comamonas jiangduensis TaxID=1194168 RepID=UPI001582488A|nr:porin [Comamonas jiangduensis]